MDLRELKREEYLALPDDDRPHLYPDRTPSDSTYVGTRSQPGCRCSGCRAEHAAAVRNRRQTKVIQVIPDSVTDAPVPGSQDAADPAAEAVYGRMSPPTGPEDITREVLNIAARMARSDGALPGCDWMISASKIAVEWRVPLSVGQQVTRNIGPYIKIGPTEMLYLVKRPVGL